jgi:EmrB/QacA subfamily drug resistance transporter
VFITIAIGTFISVVDHGSVLIALPVLQSHFGVELSSVQWVVVGYGLTISALLLPMGRLGDYFGKNRIYMLGMFIFAVASMLAIFSPNLTAIIICKILQGIGSAMVQANAIAIIISTFSSSERGKALGSHLSVVGTGLIIGPALGGLLINSFGWRSVFLVNVPVGILGILVAIMVLGTQVSDKIDFKENPFDWKGALLSSILLATILLIFGNGNNLGWSSYPIIIATCFAIILLVLFVRVENRIKSPLLDLTIFKNPLIGLGIMSSWVSFFGTGGVRFIMPFFMQRVLHLDPLTVGLSMIPPAFCMVIFSPISGFLSDKYGWKRFTILGLTLSSSSCLLLSLWVSETSTLWFLVPMLMLQTSGNGIFNSPNNSSILNAIDKSKYGVMSAMTQLVRNSANVVSMSITTSIIVLSMTLSGSSSNLDNLTPEMSGAFVSGLQITFLTLGIVLCIGLVGTIIRK